MIDFERLAPFVPEILFEPKQISDWSVIAESIGGGEFVDKSGDRIWLDGDIAFNRAIKPAVDAFEIDAKNSGLMAMAYMFRRFGAPLQGSDEHKDIACYHLTTPNPSVCLRISVESSPLAYCFGIGLGQAILKGNTLALTVPSEEIYKALSVTAAELLRPIRCRDVMFNVLGRVDDTSGWIEQEDGEYVPIRAIAKQPEFAGYGWTVVKD